MINGDSRLTLPLDLAVVGCGRVVERYHLPALQRSPEWNVVGACDPSEERRQWMRGQLDQLPVFDSFASLTENCRPDAVLVATPPRTHAELVGCALDMGMHVLVEKPMALTAADADRMRETSLRARRFLGVAFSRRWTRGYLELRERLAPARDRVQLIRFALFGNTVRWNAVTDFLGDDRSGGGALDDLASHQLDLLPWLLDDRPSRLRARHHTRSRDRSERVVYELEFVSGRLALCSVGHAARNTETLQVELGDRQLVVYRNRLLELPRLPAAWTSPYCKLRTLRDLATGRARPGEGGVPPFVRQLRAFASAVRHPEERPVMADADSGASTVRATEALRESVRSGGSWISVQP